MMTLIFALWLVVILLAWVGFRRSAVTVFVITLVMASFWFHHHVTSHLDIQL